MRMGEEPAQRIVEEVLGLTLTKRAEEDYDFDMRDADGQLRGALEVTLATDPAAQAFSAAMDRYGPSLPAHPATRDWDLWLSDLSAEVRRIRDHFPAVLARLEQAGIHEFHRLHHLPDASLRAEVESFGISGGVSYPATAPPVMTLLEPGGGGPRGPDLINQIAREMAADKYYQLAAARDLGAPERHLFIWVTSARFLEWVTLWDDRLPPGPPDLTPEQSGVITTIWVAARNSGQVVLWRVTPPQGWTKLEVGFP
jgi:hypothetical protein